MAMMASSRCASAGQGRCGFTLLELTVYMFIALLASGVLYALYTVGTRTRQVSVASYLVSVDTDAAIRWMRRDLQETALTSVRVYPNPSAPGEPPGCSFLSARDLSEKDEQKLNVSKYGTPHWTKYVFYTLRPGTKTGQLVRWEKELDASQKDFVPRQTDTLPSSMPAGTKNMRVLLSDCLEPNVNIVGLAGSPAWKTNDHGGFRLEFVRRTGGENGPESFTSVNPADHADGEDTANNTRLLELQMQVLTSDTSRPSVFDITIRVHPRY